MDEKIIKTAKCGLLKVFVQGEIESRDLKRKSKAVFLTVHDLGSNYKSIVRFVNHPSMVNISSRYFNLRTIKAENFGNFKESLPLAKWD